MAQESKKKLLLHACCGPCSLEPTRLLREDGFTVEADGTFTLAYRYGRRTGRMPAVTARTDRRLDLRYEGAACGLLLTRGRFLSDTEARSEDGTLSVSVVRA